MLTFFTMEEFSEGALLLLNLDQINAEKILSFINVLRYTHKCLMKRALTDAFEQSIVNLSGGGAFTKLGSN